MSIVSMSTEYALLSLCHLTLQQSAGKMTRKTGLTVSQISAATGMPSNFLSKILRQVARSGIIRSTRGCHGGYILARPAEKISVLEVLEAVEGPFTINQCSGKPENCGVSVCCPFYGMWIEAQENFRSVLGKYTLHSVAVFVQGLPEEERFNNLLRRRFNGAPPELSVSAP